MIGFGAAVPRPARSHAYASQTPSLESAQGLLLARVGSPLARQDSHLLDDERSFMVASQPPIPFDQPCLVALIVQADNLQTGLSQVIVAMITSRLFRADHPSRIVVEVSTPIGQGSGLLTDSVVMTDNLATVAEVAIDRVIGTLPMTDVETALRHTLKL